ncbi:MAG: manganese efflux pump [Clostridia bacterium]|nr:manganese efflux pump [Clostridia bacterium]
MHGFIFLMVTALTVSVDSFLCGFTLATKRRELSGRARLTITLFASFTVGMLCTVGAMLGSQLGMLLAERAQMVGGIVLFAMGTTQLLSVKKKGGCVNSSPNNKTGVHDVKENFARYPKECSVGDCKENAVLCPLKKDTNKSPSPLRGEGEKSCLPSQKNTPLRTFLGLVSEAVLIGVGIGSDGAMASVMLAATGYPPLIPALAVTLCHVALIGLGLRLAECKKIKKLAVVSLLAPLFLIALGAWKIVMP